MFNYRKSQRGQAIVLIALAIVGLLGITALAIDSGNAFSDRRHAQMAADNAALAGALAKTNPSGNIGYAINMITSRNGYTSGVTYVIGGPFVNCKGAAVDPVNHSDPDDNISQYVQVTIHSSVNTFFGPVIGITRLNNCVFGIARAQPEKLDTFMSGQAIAAMDCHAKDAITVSGSGSAVVIGGGIFSNSDHDAYSMLINDQSALGLPKPPLSSVGTSNTDGLPYDPASQLECDVPEEMLPPVPPAGCDVTYNDFPPNDTDEWVDVGTHHGDPVTIIKSGVFCITGVMGNPEMETAEGVTETFVLVNLGLSWSSSTQVTLRAPTDPANPFNGILIYAPKGNTHELKFNGTAGIDIEGSIIAPTAKIVFNGDFTGSQIESQLIGATVDLTGNFTGTIEYNDKSEHVYVAPPRVELSR